MTLMVHLLLLGFAALIVVLAAIGAVVDMFGRVDYLRDKFPSLNRILERRSAMAILLFVGVLLLVGDGFELLTKEMPEVPVLSVSIKAPVAPTITQTKSINVQEPCKLTAEQINPARLPQPCPGAPPPTLQDKVMAINTHLTEGDRNRFSDALSEFSDSLRQGETVAYKLNTELGSLGRGENEGTIAKEVQEHVKILSDIAAEGWKYQKAFPALRTKWDMFRDQEAYIFGDNPDNEGPNAIINGADAYRNYLEWWNVIPNKDQKPVLNLLSVEHNESQSYLTTFFKWERGCVSRLNEMRNSIH